MKARKSVITALCLAITLMVQAREVKNIIVMIPDGTSVSDLALARWYKFYQDSADYRLAMDPYYCGMVKTHSSNAPIGDSAPTGSAYMTGVLSQTGFIGMSPPQDANDLVKVDPERAYSPQMSVFEAARTEKGKAVGLVFTCEFPHATPAGTSAHWYSRKDYPVISSQMVHNSIDVLIGGGAGLLTGGQEAALKEAGCEVYRNDRESFEKTDARRFWALFGDRHMTNDMDRDPSEQPSLAEMTEKAIATLRKNESGFCLLVEGSKIDWSSHRNDPIGIISETLAFDAAVKVAIDFAKENKETLVLICPDHGNGGIAIGNSRSDIGYDKLSLGKIMEPLMKCRKTSEYLTEYLPGLPKDSIQAAIGRVWGIREIGRDTIDQIDAAGTEYLNHPGSSRKRDALNDLLSSVLQSRTYIGFTTHGHTGENVFLAVYHPDDQILKGLVTAPQINAYLCDAVGLDTSLTGLTDRYYRKASQVFGASGYTMQTLPGGLLKVTDKKNKKRSLTFQAHTNQVKLPDGKIVRTQTPAIYVDRTDTWFVSAESLEFLR